MEDNTFVMQRGYKDSEGNYHKEYELREMNGADEEAVNKPDIRNNGGKVGRVFLERCCTRIGTFHRNDCTPQEWRDIIQSLACGDQDLMMVNLRKISLGDKLTSTFKCPDPECNTDITYELDIDELEIVPYKGADVIEFELPKGYYDSKNNQYVKTGTLRLPNGLDREILDPIIRRNIGQANTMMLTRCILSLGDLKITDSIVKNLTLKDRNYLLELVSEHSFGVSTTIDVDCPTCGKVFKASLNATNFI